jgi:hypothetical protein
VASGPHPAFLRTSKPRFGGAFSLPCGWRSKDL